MGILPMFHGLEARATSSDEHSEPMNCPRPLAFGARNDGSVHCFKPQIEASGGQGFGM